jgi:hypothetical protein
LNKKKKKVRERDENRSLFQEGQEEIIVPNKDESNQNEDNK